MKKVLSLLLVVMMTVSLVATTAFAANGNFTFSLDKTEYEVGDTVVVTVNSLAKTISTEGFNVKYDPTKVSYSAIKAKGTAVTQAKSVYLEYEFDGDTEKQRFSVAENNATESQVAFGFSNTEDVTYLAKDAIVTIEFIVKDGATGDLTFILNENSAGATGYVGVVDTKTATVKSAAPADPVTVTGGTAAVTGDKDDTKVWAVAVAGDQVAKGDVLTATLSYNGDTQIVPLTVNVEGGADWSFNLRVRFKDCDTQEEMNAKRDATTLTVVKAAN